jgi:cytochrome c-type biogenesis protein CcmF
MKKGETKQISGLNVTFTEFEMANHQTAGHFRVGAVLEIEKEDEKFVVKPAIIMGSEGREVEPALLPGMPHSEDSGHPAVILAGLNADEKRIQLVFQGLHEEQPQEEVAREQLIVEVSEKPFMSILWIGTILLILGSIIAFMKRLKAA